jgi:DNA-binding transcriptional MerR regulator
LAKLSWNAAPENALNQRLESSKNPPDAQASQPSRAAARPETELEFAFKTREVVELLGLSRRQLQYWAKTGLVEPSARTPGGHHRYSFADLVALKATKRLIDGGVSVQKIRKSVGALQNLFPQIDRPLGELVLVATGDVVLVFREDTVFEAITGQEWVFAVADFEREVEVYRAGGVDRVSVQNGHLESLPAKPRPRGARPIEKDWSQTG